MKIIIYYLVLVAACLLLPLHAGDVSGKNADPDKSKISFPLNSKIQFTDIIVLKSHEVSKLDAMERVQRKYIDKKYPNYHVVLSLFFKDGNKRFIEIVSLVNDEGEKARVRFDMTEVYKNLKTKNKDSREKIEELESFYIDLNQKQQP